MPAVKMVMVWLGMTLGPSLLVLATVTLIYISEDPSVTLVVLAASLFAWTGWGIVGSWRLNRWTFFLASLINMGNGAALLLGTHEPLSWWVAGFFLVWSFFQMRVFVGRLQVKDPK